MVFILSSEYLGGLGRTTDFVCTAPDLGNPSITWMHNGIPLSPNDEKYSGISSTTLTISDIIYTDEGEYVCMYENNMSQQVNRSAGCLHVYGEFFYKYCTCIAFFMSLHTVKFYVYIMPVSFNNVVYTSGAQCVRGVLPIKVSNILTLQSF